MRKPAFFYAKLAASNIRKNSRLYLPYGVACICTVAMFYIMLFISTNNGLGNMAGADSLILILRLGSIVIGIFSVILLFYTNGFLMKQRKRELGLYNILGMEKKHIARILLAECLYVATLSLSLGLGAGILFSKLVLMLLLNLVNFPIPFGFQISPAALSTTAILFGGIFLLTLLKNLRQVQIAQPIELLHSSNTGEREPRTKWPLAIIGFLCLGAGYAIAIFTKNPLEALLLFFVAVILVIIGTYSLFTAGSIAVLKLMRRNKRYYYQANHFTSISGMLYRMRQNAVGLANICILSTMVLVMISFTTSLFFGMDDALRNQFPRNIEVRGSEMTQEQSQQLIQTLDHAVESSEIPTENLIYYRYLSIGLQKQGNDFYRGEYTPADSEYCLIYMIPLAEYNRLQDSPLQLATDEVLAFTVQGDPLSAGSTLSFHHLQYRIRQILPSLDLEAEGYLSLQPYGVYYLVLPDEQAIFNICTSLSANLEPVLSQYYGIDVVGDEQLQRVLSDFLCEIVNQFREQNPQIPTLSASSAIEAKTTFLSLYGGLFFLGIFLGLLFLLTTVLIMYYKQISEGYEDQQRFFIMQKVGMSQEEVKRVISSQVMTVFFLPLATAGLHIAAAFPMLTRLLSVLGLVNIGLFALCTLLTLLAFAFFYGFIYIQTAKAYYKIVRAS